MVSVRCLIQLPQQVGLYSEEISRGGEGLGNTPQAFSHVTLIRWGSVPWSRIDSALLTHPRPLQCCFQLGSRSPVKSSLDEQSLVPTIAQASVNGPRPRELAARLYLLMVYLGFLHEKL
jgi:hypothetical protein